MAATETVWGGSAKARTDLVRRQSSALAVSVTPINEQTPMRTPRQVQAAQRISHPGGKAAAAPAMAKRVQDFVQGAGGWAGSSCAASQHHQPNAGS
eukprot:2741497-Pyramimonas_sp.AAC.1